jgi:biotin synthase
MTDRELRQLVIATGPAAAELHAAADRVRCETVGEAVHLRGIIEFSSYCRCHCEYCGLRADNAGAARLRLSPERTVAACEEIATLGFGTVVLQSGEDDWWTAPRVAALVAEIKAQTALAVTLSLGERPEADYRLWREAGADRYLLKHETANRELYQRLHPGSSYDQRLACHDALFALGYQVGSGCIVGLPGQTPEMLVEDLRLIEARRYHMCGVGPLIPHPGTPLGALPVGSVAVSLNMVALTRLLVPDVMLPATTALETAAAGARLQALQAGANVLMPNLTPREFAGSYEIYPGKQAPHLTLRQEIERTRQVVAAAGRPVGLGPGHSPRIPRNG